MKNINYKQIVLPIIAFVFVYLVGVFAYADFNISNWTDTNRYGIASFGAVGFIGTVIATSKNFE